MNRSLLLLILILTLSPLTLWAGRWEAFTYATQYQRVCRMGDYLYILKGSSLLRANAKTWQIDRELSRDDGLSGNQILDICYSYHLNRIAIVYANGIIDVMHPDGSVWTIPDLYNAPMAGTDKTILSVREQDGHLFLHTQYGFGIVDLDKQVFLHNFNLGGPVSCAWYFGDNFFYSNASGIFYCPRTGGNPHMPSGWIPSPNAYHISQAIIMHQNGKEQCWLLRNDKKLCRIYHGENKSWPCYSGGTVSNIQRSGRYIMASTTDSLVLFDTSLGLLPINEQELLPGQRIACRQLSPPADGGATGICPLDDDGQSFALLYANRGIYADTITDVTARKFKAVALQPKPLTKQNSQQSDQINRILTTGDQQLAMSYVLPLKIGYGKMLQTDGFLTTYNTATHQWQNLDKTCVTNYGLARFCSVSDMVIDPQHPERYWFSTLEDGIIGIDHGQFFTQYNAATTNQGLQACAPGCTRVAGMAFNAEGDLWCCNEGLTQGLRVLRKSDDKWYKFQITGLEKTYGFTYLCATQHNGRHQIWGSQNFKYQETNIFCYEYGDNIADASDDRFIFFKTLKADYPGAVPFTPYYTRGIYEGPTGAIWLLNTSGIYVIDNPDLVFDHPGTVRQIMNDVVPTSLCIDTNNLVWVSTETDGIYLFTPDGTQQLAHYNSANSILGESEANSVAFDPATYTLWVATNGSILSYEYSPDEYATEATDFTTQACCYPSQVRLGTATTVNVYGLKDETKAYVLNSQGRILQQDTALGGIININTQSLPVGTYTVNATDAQGNHGDLLTFDVLPSEQQP